MNAQSQAQRRYSDAAAPTRTYKQVEYEALARITHRMQVAERNGQTGFSDLVQALHDNRRLWNVFATEVSDAANPLPQDLKARLFYLAEFIRLHSSKVLTREESQNP